MTIRRGGAAVGGLVVWTLAAAVAASLAGCGNLPDDGPSARTVLESARAPKDGALPLANLSFSVTQEIASVPPPPMASLAAFDSRAPNDLIQPGDTLAVSVTEPTGAALGPMADNPGQAGGVGTQQQAIPPLLVNPAGSISLPFAGEVHVAGLTSDQAADAVRQAFRGRFADPQVLVTISSTRANTVSVLGDVRNVGRFPIGSHADRLMDVIAEAGGPLKPYQDLDVEIVRGARSATVPMSNIMASAADNIRLAPEDQIRILPDERKFSIFGAFDRPAQEPIIDDHLSLAGAISRSGGLDTFTAANGAVFLFRFERPEVVKALGLQGRETPRGVPMIYRLDMRTNGQAFLIADTFMVRNGDMIYVPRANLVAFNKFMQAVNSIAQASYSAKVTGVP
ncbi:MAG: polysaccharide export protein [Alphaproteobacteria bacterium]|nr:polysaccharide export protein [Alphaproteobacteria bacterium]